jgi:hypothetical protein
MHAYLPQRLLELLSIKLIRELFTPHAPHQILSWSSHKFLTFSFSFYWEVVVWKIWTYYHFIFRKQIVKKDSQVPPEATYRNIVKFISSENVLCMQWLRL